MTAIGKVSLRGIVHDDFQYTVLLKTSDAVAADAGKAAMTNHSSAANTFKLAVDGSKIYGRLEVYEDRTVEGILVGTVALKGGIKFIVSPTAGADAPAVGDFLVGAVDTGDSNKGGYVRKAGATELDAGKTNWLVMEIGTDAAGNDFAIAINV